MEVFALASAMRGYHVYQDVWKSLIGEKLVAKTRVWQPSGQARCESSVGQLK